MCVLTTEFRLREAAAWVALGGAVALMTLQWTPTPCWVSEGLLPPGPSDSPSCHSLLLTRPSPAPTAHGPSGPHYRPGQPCLPACPTDTCAKVLGFLRGFCSAQWGRGFSFCDCLTDGAHLGSETLPFVCGGEGNGAPPHSVAGLLIPQAPSQLRGCRKSGGSQDKALQAPLCPSAGGCLNPAQSLSICNCVCVIRYMSVNRLDLVCCLRMCVCESSHESVHASVCLQARGSIALDSTETKIRSPYSDPHPRRYGPFFPS